MQPHRIIPTLDIAEAGHLGLGLGCEPAAAEQLGLEGGEEALGHGVVVGLPSGEYRRLGYCVGLTCGGARPAARSSAMICCKHSMPYCVKAVTPCSPTPKTRRQPSSGN